MPAARRSTPVKLAAIRAHVLARNSMCYNVSRQNCSHASLRRTTQLSSGNMECGGSPPPLQRYAQATHRPPRAPVLVNIGGTYPAEAQWRQTQISPSPGSRLLPAAKCILRTLAAVFCNFILTKSCNLNNLKLFTVKQGVYVRKAKLKRRSGPSFFPRKLEAIEG